MIKIDKNNYNYNFIKPSDNLLKDTAYIIVEKLKLYFYNTERNYGNVYLIWNLYTGKLILKAIDETYTSQAFGALISFEINRNTIETLTDKKLIDLIVNKEIFSINLHEQIIFKYELGYMNKNVSTIKVNELKEIKKLLIFGSLTIYSLPQIYEKRIPGNIQIHIEETPLLKRQEKRLQSNH